MSQWLKQSTAITVKLGPFLDDTDGKTAETGLTISQADVRLSKNGGDFAQKNEANAATHDENGFYDVALDTTDTNTLGRLLIAVSESGALPVWQEFMVVPANVWDSMFGADYLQVDAVQIEGSDASDQVNAACDTALSDYDAPTKAEMDAGFAALNDPTAADIADAVLDEALAGHTGAGSLGKAIADIETDAAAILEDTGTTLPGTLATIDGKIDTVDGIVDNILTDTAEIGAAGAGLSAIPWNAAWDAEIQSEVQDAIEANHLDHLLAADYDPANKPGVATALLNELVESDGGVSRFTANALEQAPSGSGVGDWTADEKEQIRYRLQIDGTQTAPAVDAPLQMPSSGIIFNKGTIQSAGFGNAVLESSASSISDYYNHSMIAIVSGTGAGQIRRIDDYNGSTRNCLLIEPWKTIPSIDSVYVIIPFGTVEVGRLRTALDDLFSVEGGYEYSDAIEYSVMGEIFKAIKAGVFDELLSGHTTVGTMGERIGRIPNAAPGSNGGLPTVNASNQVAGVSGDVVGSIGSLATQAKADVQAEAAAALAAYDPPTHAELTAALAALNNLSAAEVQTKIEEFWQTFALPELAAGQSPAEATPAEIMAFLWMYFRGPQQSEKTGETTGIQRVHNDAGEIVLDAAFTKTETEYTREKLSLGD